MGDLKSAGWIKLKGWLFLLIGVLSGGLLLAEHPDVRTALLLGVCVWAFCRFYFFAFYVIERWVDPSFKFAGLGAFVRYWFSRRG